MYRLWHLCLKSDSVGRGGLGRILKSPDGGRALSGDFNIKGADLLFLLTVITAHTVLTEIFAVGLLLAVTAMAIGAIRAV